MLKKIESEDETKYDTFYSNSDTDIIINESDNDDVFESVYTTLKSNAQKHLGKGSGWIIDLVIDQNINISNYNLLAGGSYIELPKELDHQRKRLISIQNIDDNECFKWRFFTYLNPADRDLARITKAHKDFAKKK